MTQPPAAPTRPPLVARRLKFLAGDMERAAASVRSIGDEAEARVAAAALAELVGQAGAVADRLAARLERYARANADRDAARQARTLARSLEDLAAVVAGLASDVQQHAEM
jgi:N-acetylglucosamine kinase-like BadF-type ATPase